MHGVAYGYPICPTSFIGISLIPWSYVFISNLQPACPSCQHAFHLGDVPKRRTIPRRGCVHDFSSALVPNQDTFQSEESGPRDICIIITVFFTPKLFSGKHLKTVGKSLTWMTRQPYRWVESLTTCPWKADSINLVCSGGTHSIHFWMT